MMGRAFVGFLAGIGILSAFPPLGRAEKSVGPLTFEPTTTWQIDYAEDYCAARRAFAKNGNRAIIEIRQYRPGPDFDLLVLSDTSKFRREKSDYRFYPHASQQLGWNTFTIEDPSGLSGFISGGNVWNDPEKVDRTMDRSEFSASADSWARRVEGIVIEGGFREPLFIRTGTLGDIRNAMSVCLDELVNHWGIDVVAHHALARHVKPDDAAGAARRIRQNYPIRALKAGAQGPVHIRVLVDKFGKPTACKAIAPLIADILVDATCETMMTEAKFLPALDANGDAIDSYYMTTVSFRLGTSKR